MPKSPALTGKTVINTLENIHFRVVRQKSSHVQIKHEDGCLVTIAIHAGKTIGRGVQFNPTQCGTYNRRVHSAGLIISYDTISRKPITAVCN